MHTTGLITTKHLHESQNEAMIHREFSFEKKRRERLAFPRAESPSEFPSITCPNLTGNEQARHYRYFTVEEPKCSACAYGMYRLKRKVSFI